MNNAIRSIIEQMKDDPDQLDVLRAINNKTNSTLRELASDLGFSLGKLNYCLLELRKKGLVKIESFKKDPSKIR